MQFLRRLSGFIGVLAGISAAQDREPAVALILESANAVVYPKEDRLELPAVPGEVLFTGDRISVSNGWASILRCGPKSGHRLRLTEGAIVFGREEDDESEATVRGRVPATPCLLPELERRPAVAVLDAARGASVERAAAAAGVPRNSSELQARVARAVALEKQGDYAKAIDEYSTIGAVWPEQQWARRLVYRLAAKTGSSEGSGKLYALVLGVSNYGSQTIRPLKFADADALLVSRFLSESARGKALGGGPEVIVRTNADVRYGTVRTLLNEFFAQAGRDDSILLFIAAHGIAYNQDGYVILHDSEIQSLYTTGISMSEIRDTLAAHAARVSRVFLFVDACHAQRIGPIRDFSKVNEQLRSAINSIREGQIFAFFAASGDEEAFEHPKYGGGHGAFTYFLVRAFNITREYSDYARTDYDGDGYLTPKEVIEYVADRVRLSTNRRQRPQGETRLTDLRVPLSAAPLSLPCCNPLDRNETRITGAARDPTIDPEAGAARGIPWGDPRTIERRIELENRIHEIITRYLEGDEQPQQREDFSVGAVSCIEARQLSGGSLFLEGREEFFRGRALIFDKRYAAALDRLHRAIRLDPASPYSFNALGIAYLEQAQYHLAIAAFRDAIRRAPYWAYPRHNLALAFAQLGDYGDAIAAYREAMRLAPRYSYLPYNLGLLYQRMNRDEEAEALYRLAREKAPWRAGPSIALGVLMMQRGREAQARKHFAEAWELLAQRPEPDLVPTLRHNQALLLARRDLVAADALLRRNIDEYGFLPSRFALAQTLTEALSSSRRPDSKLLLEAEQAWRDVLAEVPENVGAKRELARLEKLTGGSR
jgi:tetratricopeptide (TPR) repeat protein